MNYLYEGALSHQILFYSYSYKWESKPTRESFARDFIMEELSIAPEKIPSAILQTVVRAVANVMPADRFTTPI